MVVKRTISASSISAMSFCILAAMENRPPSVYTSTACCSRSIDSAEGHDHDNVNMMLLMEMIKRG
jgi:hypothetical protein